MDEVPKDVLKSIFDKVNTERTPFPERIGVKLVELLPRAPPAPLFPLPTKPSTSTKWLMEEPSFPLLTTPVKQQGTVFGEPAVALQQNIHFLAAGKSGDFLEATAKVIHRSNRIGLIEFEVRNQEGLLIAIGQQVIYFKKGNQEKDKVPNFADR